MNEFEFKYNLVYSVVKGLIQGSPAFDPEITDLTISYYCGFLTLEKS